MLLGFSPKNLGAKAQQRSLRQLLGYNGAYSIDCKQNRS